MASPGATIALTLAEQVAQKRLKAYHGSPHDFDKFSSENIGTGEGAQAYGHGLYFAEREGTAKNYRDALSGTGITPEIREKYFTEGNIVEGYAGKDKVLRYNKGSGSNWSVDVIRVDNSGNPIPGERPRTHMTQPDKINVENVLGKVPDAGRMYEVDIDVNADELIDYDAPLSEQSDKVKEIAALYNIKTSPSGMREARGADIYSAIASAENAPPFNNSRKLDGAEEASNALSKVGIKGIRYKDAQTRFSSDGATRNYVIFDDELISISKKYGVSIPIAAAILGGSMTPDEAMADQNLQVGTQAHASDDIEPEFLAQRENAIAMSDTSALDRIIAKRQANKPPPTIIDNVVNAAETAVDVAVDVGADVARGLAETPQQILAGIFDATAEPANMLRETFGELPTVPDDYEPVSIGEADSNTGAIIRSISQFMTGFLPSMKGLEKIGVANKLIRPMLAGFITDATVFDPFEKKFSDLIQSNPTLANPVNEYLIATEDDSEALARFKAGLEGLGLGVVADGLVRTVGVIKRARKFRQLAEEMDKTPEDLLTDIAAEDQQLSIRMGIEQEQEFIPFEQLANDASVDFEIPKYETSKDGIVYRAKSDDARNINLNNLNTTDDVKALIDAVAEADAGNINDARRGTITNEQTQALANDLGMSVDDLLARRAGVAFNAEQALASRQILVASGENLIRLGKIAERGTDSDLIMFRRAMAQHQAIQMQVSGMTAEAGRALQAFRIMAEGSAEQQRAIEEALRTTGGADVARDIARKLGQLDNPKQVGEFIRNSAMAKVGDSVLEFWINALLSNIPTHAVNFIGNSIQPFLATFERGIASKIGNDVVEGEATMMLMGIMQAQKEGFTLALKTLRTGRPSDAIDKIEVDTRDSISSKNYGLPNNQGLSVEDWSAKGVVGQAVDYIGTAVRTPGLLLSASDEYFKAIAYRMELNAQAYRTAFNEGWEGEGFDKRVREIIRNPPENIRMAAVDFKRYQTFTNELGSFGKGVEGLRNKNAYMKVMLPFIRTPLNIMTYTTERTPLALATAKWKAERAAGGARADLAMAKLATGSMIMATAADLAFEERITGKGPTNYQMLQLKKDQGWQPYSILIDGEYVAYNRLDPVGTLLGVAADISEITGQGTERDALNMATASVIAVTQNLASKTYLRSVSEVLSVMNTSTTDEEANNWKANQYASRLIGSLVPAFVAGQERIDNPAYTLKSRDGVQQIIDTVRSRIPGFNDDLPPNRNVFGEVQNALPGYGGDYSPITVSEKKYAPVSAEMERVQAPQRKVKDKIGGVQLTTKEHDRYIMLAAGVDAPYPSIKSSLLAMFNTTGYQRLSDGPDGSKNLEIDKLFTKYRDMAKNQFLREHPHIRREINRLKEEMNRKLMPQ